MYGPVNVAIRDMVIEGYGVKTWARYTACWRIAAAGYGSARTSGSPTTMAPISKVGYFFSKVEIFQQLDDD